MSQINKMRVAIQTLSAEHKKSHEAAVKYYKAAQDFEARNNKLEAALLLIGEMAVNDFNDPVVGVVDGAIPAEVRATYLDKLKEFYALHSKLAKFKEFVHTELDNMNIPTNPGGPHTEAGCRIGDRLEIVKERLGSLEAARTEANHIRCDLADLTNATQAQGK